MKKYLGAFILFIVALIFGFSYVFQAEAANYVGPFGMNAIRYFIGAICLLPFMFKKENSDKKQTIKVGIAVGFCIFLGSLGQQLAANHVSAGKVGFITSLYIVEVPIIAYLIYKKRISNIIKFAIVLALIGLGLLCNITDFGFGIYELYLVMTSISFAFEIILVSKYGKYFYLPKFIFVQFVAATLFSLGPTIILETISLTACKQAIIPILYIGVGVGAIGYFLQDKGQTMIDGTTASLVMSLESVISVIAGFLLMNELLTTKEIIGCILMFTATVVCVINSREKESDT